MASATLSKRSTVGVISKPNVMAGELRSINDFPNEIMLKILSHFGPEDLCLIIAEVCERWNVLAKDVTLWKTLSYSCHFTSDIRHVDQVRCATLLGFRTDFNLLIVAKVSRECLVIIWLVTDPFILLTAHSIINLSFISFPLHPHSTAGKTVVCSSLTFVLVETLKFSLLFLSNFPLLLCSSLLFS
jgi:hypothetical protein